MQDEKKIENADLMFKKGEIVSGFKMLEMIGEGGFGVVYKVSKNDEFFAMKFEKNDKEGGSALKLEVDILKRMRDSITFPRYIAGGRNEKYQFIVIELLGRNLKTLRERSRNEGGWSSGTWSRVAVQCLYAVKALHDKGILHRDIKPTNFATGNSSSSETTSRRIFLFDFGLARRFVVPRKSGPVFRLARLQTEFRGTPLYASPNAHALRELGRHDDVWSCLYMVAEMVCELPWTNVSDTVELGSFKETFTLPMLFADPQNPDLLTADMCARLTEIDGDLRYSTYYSNPDYDRIQKFFVSIMIQAGVTWNTPYDWETAGDDLSAGIKKIREEDEKTGQLVPWEKPGPFFKVDQWANLPMPSRDAVANEPSMLPTTPIGKLRTDGKTANGRTANEKDDNRNTGHKKIRDVKIGDVKNGDVKNGDVKNGDVKNGDVKNGDVKIGDVKKDNGNTGNGRTARGITGDMKNGYGTTGHKKIRDVKNDDVKNGDVKIGDVKNGDVKNDDVKNGDVKIGDVKNDDVKNGDVKIGDVKNDDVKNGDVKIGDVKNGDVKNDDVKNGDVKKDNGNTGNGRTAHGITGDKENGDGKIGDKKIGDGRTGDETTTAGKAKNNKNFKRVFCK